MRFRFSILRLMLAVTVLAVVFVLTELIPFGRIFLTLMIGLPLAGVALIATERDIVPILRKCIGSGAGAFIVYFLVPRVHPPYQAGDDIPYVISGAIIGWIIAVRLSRVGVGSDKNGQH